VFFLFFRQNRGGSFNAGEEIGQGYLESPGYSPQIQGGQIAAALFHRADIRAMQPAPIGEILL